jgi:hypothetical protein
MNLKKLKKIAYYSFYIIATLEILFHDIYMPFIRKYYLIKWDIEILHYISILVFIVITIDIIISSNKKDNEIEKLIKNEMILRDLKIIVLYIINTSVNKIDPIKISFIRFDSYLVKSNENRKEMVQMCNNDTTADVFFSDEAMNVKIIFTPLDDSLILNKPLSFLKMYELYVIPYKDINREIIAYIIKKNKGTYNQEKIMIKINIIINGKKFKDIQASIDDPIETEWLDVKDDIGIFGDIEKLYDFKEL